MSLVALFIDGGYLDKLAMLEGCRVDYQKLVTEMTEGAQLLRAYYYHCLPYKSSPPTDVERERFARMESFFTALKRLPRVEVRLGKLAFRGHGVDGQPIFVQKRVDTMVGVDMALLAGKGRVASFALLSGDSDFIPAVEAVKREGVIITLWYGRLGTEGSGPSRELFDLCDERREMNGDVFRRIARGPRL